MYSGNGENTMAYTQNFDWMETLIKIGSNAVAPKMFWKYIFEHCTGIPGIKAVFTPHLEQLKTLIRTDHILTPKSIL